VKRTVKERRIRERKEMAPKENLKERNKKKKKKEGVNLITEKTSNRTNITGGAKKFQRRYRNKRSNGEDTGY